jgi:hypothetical protein
MWPAAPGAHRHRQVDPAAFCCMRCQIRRAHTYTLCPFPLVAQKICPVRETRFSRDKHLGTEGVLATSSRPKKTILEPYHGSVYQL